MFLRKIIFFRIRQPFVVLGLCALLAGCQASSGRTPGAAAQAMESERGAQAPSMMKRDVGSEELLESSGGRWAMVEEESAPSPAQLHAQARKGVNPADMQKHFYGIDFQPKKTEDESMRVLRVVRPAGEEKKLAMMPAKSDFIFEEANVPKPARKPGQEMETIRVASAAARTAGRMPQTELVIEEEIAAHSPAAGNAMGGAIADVRFGDHPGKTRMVLDLTRPVEFQHKLDNSQNILAIEVRGARWNAGEEAMLIQHPLIAGYKAYEVDGATRIALRLKKPVKVVWSAALKPAHGKGDRLVFDIAAL